MQKIALVTDSSCDLGEKTRRDNNIEMLPFRIIYKDKEFLDQVNITQDELYKSLSEEIPTTSLPDLEYTENLFRRLKEEGYTDVIVVTVSSRLSGTLNSVKLLIEDHKEIKFHLYDSKTLGFPVGALVLEASSMIRAGLTPEEIIDKLHEVKIKLHAFVTLNTLEFLRKGGRIGRVAGAGELYPWGKCRGRKQAISKLRSIIHERLENARCKVWILNGASYDEAVALYESVKSHTNISHISLEMIGATMGVHTGPGALGVCILEE